MSIIASGPITRTYIEIETCDQDDRRKLISSIVMRLGQDQWVKLEGIKLSDGASFILPEPLGCECTVNDISQNQWANAKYEIDFASSYGRDGVFWAKSFTRLTDFTTIETIEKNTP